MVQIKLNNLMAVVAAAVCDIESHMECRRVLLFYLKVAVVEGGVGKSVAEGIERFGTHLHIVVGHGGSLVVVDG